MNYLSRGKKKVQKKETEKKEKVKKYGEIKFCFNYTLLKTWLAQLTVWYPLFEIIFLEVNNCYAINLDVA